MNNNKFSLPKFFSVEKHFEIKSIFIVALSLLRVNTSNFGYLKGFAKIFVVFIFFFSEFFFPKNKKNILLRFAFLSTFFHNYEATLFSCLSPSIIISAIIISAIQKFLKKLSKAFSVENISVDKPKVSLLD